MDKQTFFEKYNARTHVYGRIGLIVGLGQDNRLRSGRGDSSSFEGARQRDVILGACAGSKKQAHRSERRSQFLFHRRTSRNE